MDETGYVRGTKRARGSRGPVLGRRRGPYAMRACNPCRRRKGKCDGRLPCEHCVTRKQHCAFTGPAPGDDVGNRPALGNYQPPNHVGEVQCEGSSAYLTNAFSSTLSPTASARNPTTSSPTLHLHQRQGDTALMGLVSNLQGQLDNLASRVWPSDTNRDDSSATQSGVRPTAESLATVRHTAHTLTQCFHGPTSPDYSLNIAQMRLRHGSFSTTSQRPLLASIDDEAVSGDEGDLENSHGYSVPTGSWPSCGRTERSGLEPFRSIMSLQDAVRLLLVYQEVVGEFHPLVDLNDLIGRVRAWYTDVDTAPPDHQESPSQSTMFEADEKFLIIHLALAIALRAESTSSISELEKTLQHRFQDALNAKLASPATGIKDVIAVLLAGIYYFFKDMLRSAWRVCGTAGRLLMELGLHNGDVSKHILTSDAQRQEAAIVVCSIIVLDRQWSAATGLPKNFQDSSFDPPPVTLPTSQIVTPYLKAMMAFLAISDKFGDSISRAVKGEMDNDNDAYELLNFQLEQWRKKSIINYSLSELRAILADPALTPPSWVILLNLRAESVRTLLLRPCFFPDSDGETSMKQFHLALGLVENAIHVLFSLDANTDIYRKQHPYYQHLLASSCALYFLLISYVERKRSVLATLPPGTGSSLSSIYHVALSLAAKYIGSSPASRRLWKRLLEMGETLNSLGILSGDGATGNEQLAKNVDVQSESWKANSSRLIQNPGNLWTNHRNFTPPSDEYFQPPGHGCLPSNYGTGAATTTDDSFQLGWTESLLFRWPLGD